MPSLAGLRHSFPITQLENQPGYTYKNVPLQPLKIGLVPTDWGDIYAVPLYKVDKATGKVDIPPFVHNVRQ